MSLTHLNPSGLHTNPAFSQGVRIDGGEPCRRRRPERHRLHR